MRGEPRGMPSVLALRPAPARAAGVREISLLRPSLRALAAARRGCEHCHRTPLVGETVFWYGHSLVCELCRPLRAEAPARDELVHSPEHDHTVKARRAR